MVGRVLGFHHRVTGLSTELDGLGELVRAITAECCKHQKHERDEHDRDEHIALARHVEIDAWVPGDFTRSQPAALVSFAEHANEDQ